ncbi:cytochrome C oxidase subunit IV family protein [Rhodopirellula europaea]|jgi:cytochrome c oxidase subunit 4|uniref:Cytochrome oxidase subunit IV n=1 Tax=Rhodopirellula europaea SH398 TaxID=1263868 RepID=M5SHE6_9BACT|nr:cytochrome C oxidase subunit IV family protein [Rhodopirellula europaea]EMI27137.1 cytochrome oxidase subunit IV [Rhodopirellula europaea SH398]MCR9206933.1 cytochrome C oxidase subunit IV family protein [bacterium]
MSDHGHSTATADSHDGHAEGDFAHPLPLPMLFGVFGALVFLTIVTVAQANYDLGSFDIAVVMFIATIKAVLVGLFFMHLAFDKPFNLIVFLSSFVFVALFVIITLSDANMNSDSFEDNPNDALPAVAAEM